jgi:hypothetical protein
MEHHTGDWRTEWTLEVKARSASDPDGSFATAVLNAYTRAQEMHVFRRLLWQRLALIAIVWLAVGLLTTLLSPTAVYVGLAMLGVGAAWSLAAEKRAARTLQTLLVEHRH